MRYGPQLRVLEDGQGMPEARRAPAHASQVERRGLSSASVRTLAQGAQADVREQGPPARDVQGADGRDRAGPHDGDRHTSRNTAGRTTRPGCAR